MGASDITDVCLVVIIDDEGMSRDVLEEAPVTFKTMWLV